MKIYFCGSIAGGREDAEIYKELISHLKKYGSVLSDFVGDLSLTHKGELERRNPREIHDRDFEHLMSADIVIAEVTTISMGVGYEIGRAVENKKRILCLHRPKAGKMLSGMIAGCPNIVMKEYYEIDEAKRLIDEFFSNSEQ